MRRSLLLLVVLTGCAPEPQTNADTETVRLIIPGGATLRAVADSLRAHALIESPRRFRYYAIMTGRERAIHAGVFDVRRGDPMPALLRVLTSGGAAAYERLILPEGLMLPEVAAAVERQLGIPAESVLEAARDSALIERVGASAETLEGYLYPSTYHVPIGATARDIVEQLVAEFETEWQPRWDARRDTLGYSRREIVILASIIEGEVRHDRDRPYVSSVYHNRLRAGWRLQADPTVIYALGRRRRLFERDYLIRSPYNTYQIDGLPPGPIGQPSTASIEAALYPASTDFFYFVAQADGYHVFSRTLREHNRAIARIRNGR